MMNKIDILKKEFDWNNPKAMPKERLLKVFLEEGDSDRQKLNRKILNPKRREQLDKMLLKHDKALKEEELISLRNTILLVFREFLDETLLKDVDTIAITTAILLDMSYMETYAIKDQHYSEEIKKPRTCISHIRGLIEGQYLLSNNNHFLY